MTVRWFRVLSTTWKSTDGTASHWKYVIDNVIVYRDVYRAFCNDSPEQHSNSIARFGVSPIRLNVIVMLPVEAPWIDDSF